MTTRTTNRPARGPYERRSRTDLSWQHAAACRGEPLALFFGPDGERQPEREARELEAKKVCAQCPVMRECAEHALHTPERHGVWGGMGEDEREDQRRRRGGTTTTQTLAQAPRRDAEELLATGLPVDQVAARLGMTMPNLVALLERAAA